MAAMEGCDPLIQSDNQNINDSKHKDEQSDKDQHLPEKHERVIRLPLSRIKSIIKMDPEVALASTDAAILIAKATVSSNFLAQPIPGLPR